ncbi:hypothetical protein [Sinorhizobium alkalisoli]|uniref:hypothetical protein n=1 Tax=Sinorhizobium alkalisoli TaxID=1752398 RepID=UPI0012A77CFE|nr:hypothetical protein [Sinorhizobium alkalisoli]QFI69623.1 hypothetical protein EKH55_4749 [Sinorhizobium alkalisoli]
MGAIVTCLWLVWFGLSLARLQAGRLTGTGFGSFAAALVLLGIGWNFLYIGGTTLLTTTDTQAEKRAQAVTT